MPTVRSARAIHTSGKLSEPVKANAPAAPGARALQEGIEDAEECLRRDLGHPDGAVGFIKVSQLWGV